MPDRAYQPPLPPPDTPDVWERLAAASQPIIIYGTGNGADKIIDELSARGIRVDGVFASDGFVRDRTFRGHKVVSYDDIKERFDEFIVLLAFGTSRPDVMENIARIASETTLLCPDVPAFGRTVFDGSYYRENYDAFLRLADSFADDESRRTLSLILLAKLTGELEPLLASSTTSASSTLSALSTSYDPSDGVLAYEKYETIVDLGAYTGDTVRGSVKKMTRLRRVYAFEPEKHAFSKLSAYADATDAPEIIAYNAAAWDSSGTVEFVSGSGRGSTAVNGSRTHRGARVKTVQALAVDDVLADKCDRIDFIKFDVEGAEAEALRGVERTIRRDAPDLLVSVYHKTEDLLTLPALVSEMCPAHKLYLRRGRGVPAWDINLYAIRRS